MAAVITGVLPGSKAAKKRIAAGDTLLSVNGHTVTDVLDYRFYLNDTRLEVAIRTAKGKEKTVKIKKDEDEDIGLQFDTYLMDKQRCCKNKCIFCFIDQLPKGLRESLYFKDDDSRLSFLFGNYITMTNLEESEIDRIIQMHISPVNVSVHTMNPDLRVKMMKNPNAASSLRYLKKMADAGITLNTQLVLCPGINDGDELLFSLTELAKLAPAVQSVAAVPIGLTCHREGLYPLRGYTAEEAGKVIDMIETFNAEEAQKGSGVRAYAADEFFIKAGRRMPDEAYYADYPQLENGVGMWTLLRTEFMNALANEEPIAFEEPRRISCVTGEAAYPLIKELADAANAKCKGLQVQVFRAENRLFGQTVTVAGLLCGADMAAALQGQDLGEKLLIPAVTLRREEDMFLDDMTIDELSHILHTPVVPVINDGAVLLDEMLGLI